MRMSSAISRMQNVEAIVEDNKVGMTLRWIAETAKRPWSQWSICSVLTRLRRRGRVGSDLLDESQFNWEVCFRRFKRLLRDKRVSQATTVQADMAEACFHVFSGCA